MNIENKLFNVNEDDFSINDSEEDNVINHRIN